MVDGKSDVYNCLSIVDFEVQIVSVTCQLVSGFFFCSCLPICATVHVFILVDIIQLFHPRVSFSCFLYLLYYFLPANYMHSIPYFQQVVLGFGVSFVKGVVLSWLKNLLQVFYCGWILYFKQQFFLYMAAHIFTQFSCWTVILISVNF